MTVLAFDLGGTRLKAGVVEHDRVVAREVRPSPPGDQALETLIALGQTLLVDARSDAVGLAVPGLVADGEVVSLPGKHEGLVGVDLAKGLREAFDCDALVVNDAIAYGVGEARGGAGAGYERVVVMTIGTGIGVTVIQRGEPVTPGMLGGGILGGQIPIGSGGSDTAGHAGTIEALCRADRIDEVPLETYRADLTRALVALAHAHTPGCIVVGGGPISAGTAVLDGVEEGVRAHLFPGYSVDVRAASLGADAALVGLASMCSL